MSENRDRPILDATACLLGAGVADSCDLAIHCDGCALGIVPTCIVIGAATLALSFANGLFAPGDSDAHNTDEVTMRLEYDPRHRALATIVIVASLGGCAVHWRQRRGRPAAD
jgi:hypothetical protein